MKWEYWVALIDSNGFVKGLTEAGKQEWELVHCERVANQWDGVSTNLPGSSFYCVFKRPNVAANISPDLAALGFRQDWREVWARRNPFEQIIIPDPNGPQPI